MKNAFANLLLLTACGCASLPVPASSPPAPLRGPQGEDEAPFARVALALKGCASCSHCRSTIRQTVQAAASSDSVRVQAEDVEVLYRQPQPIRLGEVISKLRSNGLHDLRLVDVLLDAEGTVERDGDGTLTFCLRSTLQRFPLTVSPGADPPATGVPMRVRTVVRGWEQDGPLSLELKYTL